MRISYSDQQGRQHDIQGASKVTLITEGDDQLLARGLHGNVALEDCEARTFGCTISDDGRSTISASQITL